jgi:hypothetical protein
VVLASHQFAPPPVPEVDDDPPAHLNVTDDATADQSRSEPAISKALLGAPRDLIRRLPSVEPGWHNESIREDSLLPPEADVSSKAKAEIEPTPDAAEQRDQTGEFLRRLPPVEPLAEPANTLYRLPPVDTPPKALPAASEALIDTPTVDEDSTDSPLSDSSAAKEAPSVGPTEVDEDNGDGPFLVQPAIEPARPAEPEPALLDAHSNAAVGPFEVSASDVLGSTSTVPTPKAIPPGEPGPGPFVVGDLPASDPPSKLRHQAAEEREQPNQGLWRAPDVLAETESPQIPPAAPANPPAAITADPVIVERPPSNDRLVGPAEAAATARPSSDWQRGSPLPLNAGTTRDSEFPTAKRQSSLSDSARPAPQRPPSSASEPRGVANCAPSDQGLSTIESPQPAPQGVSAAPQHAETAPPETDQPVASAQIWKARPKAWQPVSVPVAPPRAMSSAAPARVNETFDVVARRVFSLSQKSESLAARGAYYAARAEMIKALRAITQALDTQRGGTEHSDALARAMRAFQEAEDFAPRGSQLEADLNLAQIITGHRTPVLKDVNVDHLAPLAVQQKYLEYGQEQFALACDDLAFGSYALYALARIYTVMEQAKLESQMLCLPKAVTLHQAALLVDAENVKAANELGVLLARFGQLRDARRVLLHALAIHPQPEIWMNVAVVHQRLGEAELARQAHQQGTLMASRQVPGSHTSSAPPAVQWVDPQTFSKVRPGPGQ